MYIYSWIFVEFPGVVHVVQSRQGKLHTTRSWDFLGLDYYRQTEILTNSKLGSDVIIGVVDSGIWPESKSFNDDGYGPIPLRWKGTCEHGDEFNASHCNRKIIGARWYANGLTEEDTKGDYLSPRDVNGHGTHTASTAAGSLVQNVSFGGLGIGAARGGAPRARLAIYKVLWGEKTLTSSATVLAAVDDAIHDGVDVLSLSLGFDFFDFSIGYLHAVAKGITVVFAGGNDGPRPQSITNVAPWVITVAASTIDRSFPATITLGNNRSLVGQPQIGSLRLGNEFRGLYTDPDSPSCALGTLNATMVKGKVVLCFMGNNPSPDLQFQRAVLSVQRAGGFGLIFSQYTTNSRIPCGNISCILVDYEVGIKILYYIGTTSSPIVKISAATTVVGATVVSPRPDIAAPGVNILAAWKSFYDFASGTSMATPHIAGIVALIKASHPTWSPSAIKSAIVTTASVTDEYGLPITAEGAPRKLADPFDYGGGHVNPNKALDPGLVYDIDAADYFKFHCYTGFIGGTPTIEICDSKQGSLLDLNLPSISIPNLRTTAVVWRTVNNIGEADATYKAIIEPPPGVKMEVEPQVIIFNSTVTKHSFKVTFSTYLRVQGDYTFGSLTWVDGKHSVRIPIAVRTTIQESYADISL
ncbi:subtilisin-like protein protease SBT3.7 [Cinnamomum micranthum f. kanehirae]|uniref:Subtilisin-like protein protease SBT3.7 n=1 Tax=Cinnamomum micranthum f. kanehirae TaxID=337451 RepID=A0A3S3MWC0_9MAGN|nr:subtilisin-like protein protease SBT3.7 [Cinnamomum micranthum f. kanehirae]